AFHIDFEYNIYIYEIIDDIQYNIKKILDKDEFSEEEDKLNFTEKILTCIHIFFLVIWLIMRILQGLLVPIFKKKKEFDE
ncbi:hypothetical protein IJJ97_01815, partial [bacterium]|nr:hypothetical protein [bacterium]